MTEKEKEAIELLKQQKDMPFIYVERENAIRIALKLIKKQRKEIEELQIKLMTATLKIAGLKIEAVYNNNNYISKDKIREKIQDLKEIISRMDIEDIGRMLREEQILILEEILEENNND